MALRITLPNRLGGYGLPMPEMNRCIKLSKEEQLNSGLHFALGDAVWGNAKLDLEYDSAKHHDETRRQADALRRNTIIHAGYNVLDVTPNQLMSIYRFEQVVEIIARSLGKRIRKENKGPTPARLALCQRLFPQTRWQ